ncbi:hypothetical protein ACLOJK_039333 [Asimina triloba]
MKGLQQKRFYNIIKWMERWVIRTKTKVATALPVKVLFQRQISSIPAWLDSRASKRINLTSTGTTASRRPARSIFASPGLPQWGPPGARLGLRHHTRAVQSAVGRGIYSALLLIPIPIPPLLPYSSATNMRRCRAGTAPSLVNFLQAVFLCLVAAAASSQAPTPDPSIVYLWPHPKQFTSGNATITVDPDLSLLVQGNGGGSSIVREAFERCRSILFNSRSMPHRSDSTAYDLKKITIVVDSADETIRY